MPDNSHNPENWDALRRRIIGLGEGSIHKSYYPQLQQRLRELQRFKALLDGSGEGIFLIRVPDARLVDVNESACEQLGYTCHEILELSLFDLISAKDASGLRSILASNEQTSRDISINTQFIRADGACFPVEVSLRVVRFDLDMYAVVVARNITERLRMEQDLQRSENLESLGVLAGGIAHDFNNFLTAILNQISLARDHLDKPEAVLEKLTFAENACLQAKGLTQQLLTFAKGGEPVRQTSSIAGLIDDAVRLVLAGTNIKPVLSIPDGLWLVDIDPGQMSQVLNNLLINAVHAMPDGGVLRVKARNVVNCRGRAGESIHGDHLCLTIEDSGVGIPEDVLGKIFDPYFTTKAQGSGLGLTTTYSIIRKHGGTLSVRSKEGKGTSFVICLPVSQRMINADDRTDNVFSGEILDIGDKGNVLFMDDDEMIRESMGEILQNLGYGVSLVRDGREALKVLHQARAENRTFDVAVMDLTIPGGMGGVETVRRLKAVDPLLKAVVSSGYNTAPAMAHYQDYGFDAVMAKPYTIMELRNVLHRLLSSEPDVPVQESME